VAGRSTSAARTPKPALGTPFDQTGSSASRAGTRAGRSSTRSALYSLARFLGDYQAIKNGRVGRRLYNKAIGRNVVRRMWR
jgi:hypothetical protein